MLIQRLQYRKDVRLEMVRGFLGADRPLVLWGAGWYARRLTLLMERFGVEISAYCVDEEYYLGQAQTYLGKRVTTFGRLQAEGLKVNALIAFQDHQRARELVEGQADAEGAAVRYYYIDETFEFGRADFGYYLENYRRLEEVYGMLADDLSRDILVEMINCRTAGEFSGLARLRNRTPGGYDFNLLALGGEEVFADCGAYDGDTVREFLDHTGGKVRRIYAFEPDPVNIAKLRALAGPERLVVVEKGVWDRDAVLHFCSGKDVSSAVVEAGAEGTVEIEATSIDSVFGGRPDRLTFLKMDIEGSELRALQGAARTIRRCLPKLAICVYHRQSDIVEIPLFIKSLHGGYRMHLRHHSDCLVETVLYAVPMEGT